MEDKRNFAFDKINFILLAVGMVVVILGFALMSGAGSTDTTFNADIFSPLRIKVAPVICFAGFIFVIYAVIRKPKSDVKASDTLVEKETVEPVKEDK